MKTYYLCILLLISFRPDGMAQSAERNSGDGCGPMWSSDNYMEHEEINLMDLHSDSTSKDRLFLLNPGFTDARLDPKTQLYYCPFNAMIEGILTYYPDLSQQLEIRHVDFPRPRKMIVEILGDENQGVPLLIISRRDIDLSGIQVKIYNENIFIVGTDEITKYLALAYHIPLPHP